MKRIFRVLLFVSVIGSLLNAMDGAIDPDFSNTYDYADSSKDEDKNQEENTMFSDETVRDSNESYKKPKKRVRFAVDENGGSSTNSEYSTGETTIGAQSNEPSASEIADNVQANALDGLEDLDLSDFEEDSTLSDQDEKEGIREQEQPLRSGLTLEQIEERKQRILSTKEGVLEMDESIRNIELNQLRNESPRSLIKRRNELELKYEAINKELEESNKWKDTIESKPTGDANRGNASDDLKAIKKKEIKLFNKRDGIARNIENSDQVLEEKMNNYQSPREVAKTELDSLNQDITLFRGLKSGTRTRQEYNDLIDSVRSIYESVTDAIDELSAYEEALGVKKVTKRGWFGRKRTVIDYSDVSDDNREKLKEIQSQKKELEQLKQQAIRQYRLVEETDPNNYRLLKKLKKQRAWGSLTEEKAPQKYSVQDWNRISSSYKRQMFKEDIAPYVDENLDALRKENNSGYQKSGPVSEISELRNSAPERYSAGHWNRLSAREKRTMSNEELLKYADKIKPYGGSFKETKGFTKEQDKRIEMLKKAQEQLRAEDARREYPIFARDTPAAQAA